MNLRNLGLLCAHCYEIQVSLEIVTIKWHTQDITPQGSKLWSPFIMIRTIPNHQFQWHQRREQTWVSTQLCDLSPRSKERNALILLAREKNPASKTSGATLDSLQAGSSGSFSCLLLGFTAPRATTYQGRISPGPHSQCTRLAWHTSATFQPKGQFYSRTTTDSKHLPPYTCTKRIVTHRVYKSLLRNLIHDKQQDCP